MTRGIAILAAAALFASGLAIGALGVHIFYSQKIVETGGPPMPVGPMYERWLSHRLDLSATQRDQVREILGRSRREAEELRREMGPRLHVLNRRTAEAIAEVLTPEQREELEAFRAGMENRRRGVRGEGPGRRRGRRP